FPPARAYAARASTRAAQAHRRRARPRRHPRGRGGGGGRPPALARRPRRRRGPAPPRHADRHAMTAAIELESVVKRYAGQNAVDGVTLSIAEGEFFSLLGPSGCGKTTTLRMIAGFVEPDEGRILLHGNDVTTLPANKRPVNLVFQQYALFPHMTVYENVAFGLSVKHVPRREHGGRVNEILRVVALEGYEKRRPRQLSGGQQQRVALARALVNRPAALLLDEP